MKNTTAAILLLFSTMVLAQQPRPVPLVKVTGAYQRVDKVQSLPRAITAYFDQPMFCSGMVNIDSDFNSSCGTQLVSAGNAGNIWFVEFLTGGTGVTQTFLGFRLNGDVITSLGSFYQGQITSLSIEELDANLPLRTECEQSGVSWWQKHFQFGYGLCHEK